MSSETPPLVVSFSDQLGAELRKYIDKPLDTAGIEQDLEALLDSYFPAPGDSQWSGLVYPAGPDECNVHLLVNVRLPRRLNCPITITTKGFDG